MKLYELVLMFDATLSTEKYSEVLSAVLLTLWDSCVIQETDDMGILPMAYALWAIKSKTYAHLISYKISIDPTALKPALAAMRYIAGLERVFFYSMSATQPFLYYKDVLIQTEKLLATTATGTAARKKSNLLNTAAGKALVHRKAALFLRKFITRFDEIKPRKYSNHTVSLQKKLRVMVIRSRELGMLAYIK